MPKPRLFQVIRKMIYTLLVHMCSKQRNDLHLVDTARRKKSSSSESRRLKSQVFLQVKSLPKKGTSVKRPPNK